MVQTLKASTSRFLFGSQIHGGTGGPGNDALASIVLHVQAEAPVAVESGATDFPGHQVHTYI